MANPVLNDAAFKQAAQADRAGWAAPQSNTQYIPPMTDGPITRSPGHMTMDGTVTATGVLLALLLVAGAVGWVATKPESASSTMLWLAGALGGFVIGLVLRFKPKLAPILAPLYALVMGFFLGSISHRYEAYRSGIVLQAIGATVAVFAAMLFLYKTKIIKVTDRFRRIVAAATGGLMLFYLVSFLLSFAGFKAPFISSANGFGIAFSLFAAGLAASNLALDFDTTERGVASGAPKYMEWYCAFGITSTLVWLYLELLRLLSKLNRR
jgi:uncharacterized YccA/Bax inhibitor family protein